MTEIFATVASGAGLVSLGLQLAECAVKLKRFYDNVEKAPKTLDKLSREVRLLALLLRQIDDTRARDGAMDSELLSESVQICAESTQEIIQFTAKLERMMYSYRTPGRLYTALRMRDVLDVCNDLERAKNSLMIAFQVFDHRTQVRMLDASHSLAMQQSLILLKHGQAIAQIREDTTALLAGVQLSQSGSNAIDSQRKHEILPDGGIGPVKVPDRHTRSMRHRRRCYRFRLPNWFSSSVWEVTALRSQGQWQLCLQTHNIRPAYSPIVANLLAGKVRAVQRAFQSGEASQYDIHGAYSPLQLAILSGSVEMVQFLQHCDYIDAHEALEDAVYFLDSIWHNMELHMYEVAPTSNDRGPRASLDRIAEKLVHDRRIDMDTNYDVWVPHREITQLTGHPFLLINSTLLRPMESLMEHEKFDNLFTFAEFDRLSPSLFASTFPAVEMPGTLSQAQIQARASLLHVVALRMREDLDSRILTLESYDRIVVSDDLLSPWQQLLQDYIRAGYSPHAKDKTGFSPLQRFLRSPRLDRSSGVLYFIQYWASCMLKAGLDLVDYGRKELIAWKEPLLLGYGTDGCTRCNIHTFATGFQYGFSISRWHLLVQRKARIPVYKLSSRIPGRWPSPPSLPQSICWFPRAADRECGGKWVYQRAVEISEGHALPKSRRQTADYARLVTGTQDDNLAAARLFIADDSRTDSVIRRRRSQPEMTQRPDKRVYETTNSKLWLDGADHYYPDISNRTLAKRLGYVRGSQIFCSKIPFLDRKLLFETLLKWKGFVEKHRCLPVGCFWNRDESSLAPPTAASDYTMDSCVLNPLTCRPLEAWEIFNNASDPHFCYRFPDCLHQTSYLGYVQQSQTEHVAV